MRIEVDNEDNNILRQSNNQHKLKHITVTVSIHKRSQINCMERRSSRGKSKHIAAAKYVQRKQFRKL